MYKKMQITLPYKKLLVKYWWNRHLEIGVDISSIDFKIFFKEDNVSAVVIILNWGNLQYQHSRELSIKDYIYLTVFNIIHSTYWYQKYYTFWNWEKQENWLAFY